MKGTYEWDKKQEAFYITVTGLGMTIDGTVTANEDETLTLTFTTQEPVVLVPEK